MLFYFSAPNLCAQLPDSDSDGMWDGWEDSMGLNKFNPSDALEDKDGDRISNLWEYARGSSAASATSRPVPLYDAVVDYSLAADNPLNAQFKTLQAAYNSLTSSVVGYRFTVLVKRGIYSADLDAVTTPKPVAWIAEMSRTNENGSTDADWSTQRVRGQEGVILDGELGSGAGLRFVADTVFDGFIISDWSHNHLPSANITTTAPYNFNQKSAITVYAPPAAPPTPIGRVFVVNCVISNWMPVFITTSGWTQPPIGGALTNYGGDVSLVHCSVIRSVSSSASSFTQSPNGSTTTYSVTDYRTVRNEGGFLKLINTVLWDPDALTPNPGIERVGTAGQNVQLITSIVQNLNPPVPGNVALLATSLFKPNLTAAGYQSRFVTGTSAGPLRNVGTQTGLRWDIHGEARPTTGISVDIGADEWINTIGTGEAAVDSLPDWWEYFWFGSLSRTDNQDQDADGVVNLNEYLAGTPPTDDQDNDGMKDAWQYLYWLHLEWPGSTPNEDPDQDLFTNIQEHNLAYQTGNLSFYNPLLFTFTDDLDSDGLSDEWEVHYFGNLNQNGTGNPDGDIANNLWEFQNGTNPFIADVLFYDTDGDGWDDAQEQVWFSGLLHPVTGHPISFLSEFPNGDWDSDSLTNWDEINLFGTHPRQSDSDGDGISDYIAVATGMVGAFDFDNDNLTTQQELILGTNPFVADTDGDGLNDNIDSFPLDPVNGDSGAIAIQGPPVITLFAPLNAQLVSP